ncbi:dihydroxyacetone kinase subunit DhaL [Wenjunlia tyrosinilytica]|uniref:Dihydroxyacetone kinase subunit L n=1 Tax=Wenjunlia tyrosinilytica TaxID=1544741 RepID=A0A917ZV78_9ACTN|nr:dihydroxyacetone kinase subunit DhaL [Wenjunlia tyrosinilytica]GGO97054.1 dihydroxyacetone kinase subunit L [Wenjunlia tyrosinilytica]
MDPVLDAAFFLRWLAAATEVMDREGDRLTELDSAIGDADHGINMRRGFNAASDAVAKEPPDTPGGVLVGVGRQLISKVGGASGPLYGTALRRAGKSLGDADHVTPEQLRDALLTAVDAVSELGGAAPGDKTMLDAMVPSVQAYGAALDSGAGLTQALAAAAAAADEGAAATIPLQARKGRASYLGERSIGHQDPGATSIALLIDAFARTAKGDADE